MTTEPQPPGTGHAPSMGLNPDRASFTVDKIHAAHRQLNAAIRLLFQGDDPLIVLALAGNASVLFATLVASRLPNQSWDRHAQQATGLTSSAYFEIVRKGQNFLKHADCDADALLTWYTSETEAIILWAVLNAGEIGVNSPSQQVFRSWYFATRQADLSLDKRFVREAAELFPGIEKMTPTQQRQLGLERLLIAESLPNE